MSQFNPEFERDVLTSMFRHPDTFADYQDVIEPNTFGVPAYKKLWYIMQEFQRDHKELPTATALVSLIEDYDKEGFFLQEDLKYILDNIDPILNGTPVNEQYVLDRLISWVKDKRLRRQINAAIKEVQAGEASVHDVISLVKEAEVPSEISRENEEIDFASNMMDHILTKRAQPNHNLIPTGITTFDEIIGGGPKRGYKVVIMGPPGGGKTTTCQQICSEAMRMGLGSLYLFNDDTEAEMYDRFIAHETHIPTKELIEDGNLGQIREVQEKLARSRGELALKWIDPGTTPSQVRRIIEKRIESGHRVDVVVVDHLRNMAADKQSENSWNDIGKIFVGLAAIAIEHDITIYGVMHTKREAEDRSYLTNKHIGLSYEPIKDANLVLGVWRIREDFAAVNGGKDSVRLQITKHRGGPGQGALLRFDIDFETMRMSPTGEIISSDSNNDTEIYDPMKK
jgi:replicative DNA helicase